MLFSLQSDKGSARSLCMLACMRAAHMAAGRNVEFDESLNVFFFPFCEQKFKAHILITNTHTSAS